MPKLIKRREGEFAWADDVFVNVGEEDGGLVRDALRTGGDEDRHQPPARGADKDEGIGVAPLRARARARCCRLSAGEQEEGDHQPHHDAAHVWHGFVPFPSATVARPVAARAQRRSSAD